jgi:type I restriction-modification system DNA methylase subunit
MKPLNILYDKLDFKNGSLYSATDTPSTCRKRTDWLEKGEWLVTAKRANAEKIFFVENNPVAVFAECGADHTEKHKAFNRIWSLARPRLLFLASPGEITVYDLAQKPFDFSEKSKRKNKLKELAILHDIKRVAQKLQDFHRDNIESGRIFEKDLFGDLKNRADKALIRDLKTVRRELIRAGLSGEKVKYAHALIARSIFIRYLEDRQILTEDYFRKVARQAAGWTDILRDETAYTAFDFSPNKPFYPRILKNKDFTYALFRSLARDFNGDMFPDVDTEVATIEQHHLDLVQELLYGNAGVQKKLFFYSYRFDIVPLDLISSIYEEFYHLAVNDDEKKKNVRQDGAYYTPPVLAEFVLSRTLTPEVLKKVPRVLDPACGSGIFLVEAFRRIVRYKQHEKNAPLSFNELKEILQKQIAGIEVNKEAARIAVFSLYLSMLHYLEPPSINEQIKQGNKLPNLIASNNPSKHHYHCIWDDNAFNVKDIESNTLWKDRFGNQCADVIVGNPPWGAPGKKADEAAKIRERVMLEWCHKNDKPIGDNEPSQAFLWRALDFLKDGGKAGMLVSAGVLFKHGSTTQAFREQWMNSVRLEEVFNFTHVRKFFFKGGIAPFLSVCFIKGKQKDFPVTYWSAKQVIALVKTQAVILSKYDAHILRKEDLTFSKLWKNYWFGRFSDHEFIKQLQKYPPLTAVVDRQKTGQGISPSPSKYSTKELPSKLLLNIKSFKRYVGYNELIFQKIPDKVYRLGKPSVYTGKRILVQKGISEENDPKGQIVARYESDDFCFTNSINGIRLKSQEEWQCKAVLGILWSAFARYYFFMTSSKWGLWHNEIYLNDELLQLPVVLDQNNPATAQIISMVDKLRNYHPQKQDILNPDGVPEKKIKVKRRKWELQLDEAVFELYGLNEEQKDLIRDCCEVTLPFFYQPFDSIGAMPAVDSNNLLLIETYAKIFARRWNVYLGNDEEMRAEVHVGAHGNMLAVEFFPADKGDPWNLKSKNDSWGYILERIGKALPQPMGTSQILLDGLVHVVSDSGIIIIKRNEKRFEDADATICKRMVDTMPKERISH